VTRVFNLSSRKSCALVTTSTRRKARTCDLCVQSVRCNKLVRQLIEPTCERRFAQLKSAAAKQKAINAQQQKGMEARAATVKEQAAQIQRLSAQLEVSRPPQQTLIANQ
jgi:hypothetical protein